METKLTQMEKKHGVRERWSLDSPVYKSSLASFVARQKIDFRKRIQSDVSERRTLLDYLKKYAG